MKYWLLTTEYPPLHGGGISTYCYFTAQMLSRAGYDVTVFVPDDGSSDYSAASGEEGVTLIRFNSNRDSLHSILGYTARLSYAFASVVRTLVSEQGKPDIIESQDYLGIAYYLTQFKHLGYDFMNGVPLVLTLHSPAFIYLPYNRVSTDRFPDFWTCEMEKQSIKAADLLISPTRFLVEEIKAHMDINEKDIRIIANPYSSGPFNPISSFTRNKIIYYGKLSAQKGSFALLEYFKDLWNNGFEHPLHIVGGTDIVYHPEMQTMGQLVNERYRSYIAQGLLQLHGKIQPSQISNFLQDAHVVIVPSIVDNMPYVVMEAMSLGKIVLASIQGGQQEMISNESNGFLFDHNKPSSFKTQLNKILGLSDEDIRDIGLNARRAIQSSYSFEKVYQEKNGVLEGIRGGPTPDRFPFLHQESTPSDISSKECRPLLSVVIPYYNMGAYIEECIRSVQTSTHQELEIIVINDGSSDQDSLMKLELLKRLPEVTVIDGPNEGLAAARNRGASLAKGDFLTFLDADDKVAPEYYQKAIHALRVNKNVYFAGAWVRYFENSNRIWAAFTPQPPYILIHNSLNSSSLVYKKAAFLRAGLNDKQVDYGLEDYASVIGLMSRGLNGVVLPEVLFYYRVRTGSMFRSITREKMIYSYKYIAAKYSAYYTKFAARIIDLLNANGPGYLYDNPTIEVTVNIDTNHENFLIYKLKTIIKKNERLKKIALRLKKFKS